MCDAWNARKANGVGVGSGAGRIMGHNMKFSSVP